MLNCNVYDIATHAAVELAADKFIVMTADDLQVLLPPDDWRWHARMHGKLPTIRTRPSATLICCRRLACRPGCR